MSILQEFWEGVSCFYNKRFNNNLALYNLHSFRIQLLYQVSYFLHNNELKNPFKQLILPYYLIVSCGNIQGTATGFIEDPTVMIRQDNFFVIPKV